MDLLTVEFPVKLIDCFSFSILVLTAIVYLFTDGKFKEKIKLIRLVVDK